MGSSTTYGHPRGNTSPPVHASRPFLAGGPLELEEEDEEDADSSSSISGSVGTRLVSKQSKHLDWISASGGMTLPKTSYTLKCTPGRRQHDPCGGAFDDARPS